MCETCYDKELRDLWDTKSALLFSTGCKQKKKSSGSLFACLLHTSFQRSTRAPDCIIKRNHLYILIFNSFHICPEGSVLIHHWIWACLSFADIFTLGSLQRLHPQTQDNDQVHLSILYIILSVYCICVPCIYVFTFIFESVYIMLVVFGVGPAWCWSSPLTCCCGWTQWPRTPSTQRSS